MMRTTDVVKQVTDSACEVFEDCVKTKTMFHGAVHFWRGEDLVSVVLPLNHDRDLMLRFADVGASGFGADLVAISFDAYSAIVMKNPLTGEAWGGDEMHQAATKHKGRERGWLSDCISSIAVNRAGDQWSIQRRYRKEFPRVHWGDTTVFSSLEDGLHGGGVMGDALVEAMVDLPTLDQLIARSGLTPMDLGLSADEARAHMDCATVKMFPKLGLEGLGLLHAEPGSTRAAIIEESLGAFRPTGPRPHAT